jgi:hypothetical protein
MPRYFFDVHDGTANIDDHGTVLAGLDEARLEAARFSGVMLAEGAKEFWNGEEWTVTVRDETGLTLFALTFFATDAAAAPRKRT